MTNTQLEIDYAIFLTSKLKDNYKGINTKEFINKLTSSEKEQLYKINKKWSIEKVIEEVSNAAPIHNGKLTFLDTSFITEELNNVRISNIEFIEKIATTQL